MHPQLTQVGAVSEGSVSPALSMLHELYGDYFDAPRTAAKKTVRFAEPLVSYAPAPPCWAPVSPPSTGPHATSETASPAIVHIQTKLADPTWLVPTRPAPKPPVDALPAWAPPAPSALPDPITCTMQREVLRLARLIEDEAEHISRAFDSQLQHHVETSQQLGPKLGRALVRLDNVARRLGDEHVLATTLPTLGTALSRHIRALIEVSRRLEPLPLGPLVRQLRHDGHPLALKMVVSNVPLCLPLAQDALEACAEDCTHPPTLQALSLVYRALYAEAATLPPGGDPRLQFNLPHKIYTLQKTPGQLAQLWQMRANALWTRSYGVNSITHAPASKRSNSHF